MRRTYRALPDNPSGYPLNPCREWVSLIVPETTTNLLTNPSFETNTTGWTVSGGIGAALTRVSTYQYKGAYSGAVVSGTLIIDYTQVVGPTVTVGTLYTLSLFVRKASKGAIGNVDIRAYVNGAAINFDTIIYVGDGWHRCVKTFQATATTAVGFRVYTPGGTTGTAQTLYVDALQLEAKGYPTTYCDGDQLGLLPIGLEPTPYYWTGTPHSSTSVRAATTRAGGRELTLDRYGFTLLGLMGLGLTSRVNISTELGLLDGSLYQTTIREKRAITMAGAFEASNPYLLSKLRGQLRAALAHDLTGVKQPALWSIQRYQDRQAIGGRALIAASYTDGLEGSEDQVFSEKATIKAEQYQPGLIASADRGVVGAGAASVSSVNYIIQQVAGAWSALGTGLNGAVNCAVIGPDNKLYIGGAFTTAGGSSANRIAVWDGSAWSTLGTGFNGAVNALCFDAYGYLYATGNFTTAGGGAANYIARWTGAAWGAIGSGLNAQGRALAGFVNFANGLPYMYVGGDFTTAGGSATGYIAYTDGSSWVVYPNPSFGFNAAVYAITTIGTVQFSGRAYFGGNFTTANGAAATYVAQATLGNSDFAPLGAGLNGICYALATDSAGNVYAGGTFTTADGSTATNIAQWNGTGWLGMGAGLTGTSVRALYVNGSALYAGGRFTGSGTATFPEALAQWNGSYWVPLLLDLPSTATVYAIAQNTSALYLGFDTSGTTSTETSVTLSNPGTMQSPMSVALTSASNATVYAIRNTTTGKIAYFNLTASVGERIVITYVGGTLQVTSATRGTIAGAVLPASDPDAFLLIPGSNTIGIFSSYASLVSDYWLTPLYDGLDGLTGR